MYLAQVMLHGKWYTVGRTNDNIVGYDMLENYSDVKTRVVTETPELVDEARRNECKEHFNIIFFPDYRM